METLILLMLSLFAGVSATSEPTAAAPPARDGAPLVTESEGTGTTRSRGPRSVLVVGDSLAVGAAPHLKQALPGWEIETSARTGKHADEGVAEITGRGGPLPPVVVASLGTNDDPGAVDSFAGYVQSVLDAAGPTGCVVWPNIVRPPYNGVSYSGYNRALARLYAASPNLVVVDWAGIVAADPSLLASDGVHATPSGYAARGRAIAQAVQGCGSFGAIGD